MENNILKKVSILIYHESNNSTFLAKMDPILTILQKIFGPHFSYWEELHYLEMGYYFSFTARGWSMEFLTFYKSAEGRG